MKAQGNKSFSAIRLGAVAAVALAVVVSTLPSAFAAGEVLGKACKLEGVSTGTTSTSLVCKAGTNGKLTWQKVRLSQSLGAPIKEIVPPNGSIEFWHSRPEDKLYFEKIITDYEKKYPGTKITQVTKTSGDYEATARVQILGNTKAALFAALRGPVFNDFVKSGLPADLSNERFVKRNLIAKGLGAGTVNGRVLGVPYHYLFNNPV